MQWELLKLRTEKQVTQSQMAKVIGVTEQSYRSKEKGYVEFKSSEMFAIANYFQKDIGDIFTDNSSRLVNS